MADETASAPKKEKRPSLKQLIEDLSKIHDHDDRRKFYKANPELRAVYSETNFH